MRPWFQVVEPYEFIGELGKREELLVADLGDVISGIAHPIYKDPELFVKTTYFTSGLLRLLQRVQSKINSGTGNGVIRLQNYLGGGKTHSLIALYHFLHNHEALFSFLPNTALPNDISVVNITGTHLNPLEGRKVENFEIRTIWGEIAYQLSGIDGFQLIAENDRKRISPGKEILQLLFKQNKPQVILLDEITEYLAKARGVSVHESNLATQTLVFIQELTEYISTLSKSILIISLPDSEYEETKNSNKSSLIEISQIIGRLASSEIPSEHNDLYQIIHHKLIKRVIHPKELTEIVKDFSEHYLSHNSDFPEIATKPIYKSLLELSYPFHPALIDLLYENWNELSTFQGIRSILCILAQILFNLKSSRSETPLILPSDIDLKEKKLRNALFHHLPAKFSQILVREINNEISPSTGREIDRRWKETFEKIVQTIFLASSQYKSKNCGLNSQEINFAIWKPHLSSAFTAEVLNSLVSSSKHLHIQQNKYYFSDQLNFNSKINQMKSQYKEKALQQI
ncbi:MAG: ATP-binding protein, partial [Candidatus Heimdallarchaeota archaeon]|nr:ATP-binding protein [Candidatus Heimdallarchaeota archaeon]